MSDVDPTEVAPRAARFSEKKLNKDIDELSTQQIGRKTPEREGLPAGYRMRADVHYVEQLTARSADMPVRWITLDEIVGAALIDADDLKTLVQSIVEHGVVQPLLVRQSAGQYRLITGRKRFAAARAAGLSRVPCLVHQVDDVQAEALARADNLRLDESAGSAALAVNPRMENLIGSVSEAVTAIGSATTLLTGQGATIASRVALDLVKAEAWRASWHLRAATILGNTYEWRYKPLLLAPVLSRVRDGFAPESRLSGIGLTLNLMDSNASADLDEEALVCGVTGCVIATAGLMGNTEKPEVSLAARVSAGNSVTIDVTQDAVRVAPAVVGRFLDATWVERPGGWSAAVGAGVARAVAQSHDGEALFIQQDSRGSTFRLTLARS